jgi:threonyl-tRNA synthetase
MSKKDKELSELRHSAAHLLAHAVTELFPHTQLTIGPATKDGFFYDFLPERNFKDEDLPDIEGRMRELSARNLPLTHEQMPKEQARVIFKDNKFKLELINEIPGDTVGISRQGDFYDLCRGGHVASTGDIKYFKLLTISGSYWRADKHKDPLQRITGTAFLTNQDMEEQERKKEEALKNDHRRIGKQLDLFSFHEEGVGFPFFHPKGKTVINLMIEYMRKKLITYGYQEISTPIMLSDELWKRSGHYEHYKDNMYFCIIDERSYAIKPMNCPGSFLVYNERPRSYKDLPLRLAEFGPVHRHELSGVLHGLMRVRSFTIDDGHIFCSIDQLEDEIVQAITLTNEVLKQFGFTSIKIGVSTKPKNAMGTDEIWNRATNALTSALIKLGLNFVIQEGEGAFYGPKIEFKIMDSIGREWQCSTVQVDFFQGKNFNLEYVTSAGTKDTAVVVHRAIYGSLERFFAILLEHYKGNLPFWLAPVQIAILTITDQQKSYALSISNMLTNQGIRNEFDESSDPISGKIKTAQLKKTPWMLILGKQEEQTKTITLRLNDGTQKQSLTFEDLCNLISQNTPSQSSDSHK